MPTYRLVEVDSQERPIATVDVLELPSNAALVVSVPRLTTESDFAQLQETMRSFFNKYEGWKDRPILIVRAGDIRFLRLVPVEGVSNG